jgi:hypothetical protein
MPVVRAKDMNGHHVDKKAKVRDGRILYEGTITAIEHRPSTTKITVSLNSTGHGLIAVWCEGTDMVELL